MRLKEVLLSTDIVGTGVAVYITGHRLLNRAVNGSEEA